MRQYILKVDQFINMIRFSNYKGSLIKSIGNDSCSRNIQYWVPVKVIGLLFMSFQMIKTLPAFMLFVLGENGIVYLKKYAPIQRKII